MTSTELLDALLERLPRLREQGVTHLTVDPGTGAVSMLIAPKPPEPATQDDKAAAKPYDDGSLMGLLPGAPAPLTFRERMAGPVVK
jgi:hypothetical protein